MSSEEKPPFWPPPPGWQRGRKAKEEEAGPPGSNSRPTITPPSPVSQDLAAPAPTGQDAIVPEPVEVPENLGFFEKRKASKEIADYTTAFASWKEERDSAAERVQIAQSYRGEAPVTGMVLKQGEAVFATVAGASLIEDRRGPGQWTGRSSGFSIPVATIGGRSIRYRTGVSRGHYVQGTAVPTAIDSGNVYITSQRVIFQGAKQTRECRFDKLVGFQHTDDGTIFSVSNRQKPTTIVYGAALAGWFDFRLDLALAHYQNTLPQLVAQVQADLAEVDAAKPQPPTFN